MTYYVSSGTLNLAQLIISSPDEFLVLNVLYYIKFQNFWYMFHYYCNLFGVWPLFGIG